VAEDAQRFDVLVIGSGASGLAAAVSADRSGARVALATKGSLQANNSSKAQGGIQASFGDDDSPEQHASDIWTSSHETSDKALVDVLTGDARSAIHWLEELGVEFTRDDDGRYRLARCGGATAKRLLQIGDRTGHVITKQLREAWEGGEGASFTNAPLRELAQVNGHWSARIGERSVEAGTVVLAAGGRCYAVAEQRGELSTNHPNATGEVTQLALELGAESRDLDALQYHPNGGAWPPNMQGYSIPETTRAYGAVLLQLRGRGVHRLARSARRGQPGDRRRGQSRARCEHARRSPRGVSRHDAHLGGRRGDLVAVHAAPLPRRGHRPAARKDPHLSRSPLPERRSGDRHEGRRRRWRVCMPAARSPAGRTDAIA